MTAAELLLAPTQREEITRYFEPRAAAVDAGSATVQEGLAFLHQGVLASAGDYSNGRGPNADLPHVAEVIATVAWSDMSTAFSLWCHRMVLDYLSWAPAGSLLRTQVIPRLLQVERFGSTALASAIAHYVAKAPLPITAEQTADGLRLNGRINWASNLLGSDFVMVMAAAGPTAGQRLIVAIPGDAPGIHVHPYPRLLALQATGSSSLELRDVPVAPDWVITDDFARFIEHVRPRFLRLQSSFCLGLAQRALHEARAVLKGVNEVLRPDLEELEAAAARLAGWVRTGQDVDGRPLVVQELVQLRLDSARLATAAVALEVKAVGGRGYVMTSPTARRLREVTFLPIQSPTEGQLRWELSHSA